MDKEKWKFISNYITYYEAKDALAWRLERPVSQELYVSTFLNDLFCRLK